MTGTQTEEHMYFARKRFYVPKDEYIRYYGTPKGHREATYDEDTERASFDEEEEYID